MQVELVRHSTEGAGWRLLAVAGLVLANAFFVAAEFALVGARRSRIDEMAQAGDRKAKAAQAAIQHLDRYISATQLGITLASLALGWIGEPALAGLIAAGFEKLGARVSESIAETSAAVTVAFIIITFLHIVVGELAPKTMAIRYPERVGLWTATPLYGFYWLMYPII